jgi:hypothetical protein
MEIDRRRGWTRGAGETDRENGKGKIPKKNRKIQRIFSTQQLDNSEKNNGTRRTSECAMGELLLDGASSSSHGKAKRKEVKVSHLFCL